MKGQNGVNIRINVWTSDATVEDFEMPRTLENAEELRKKGKVVDFETLSEKQQKHFRERATVALLDEVAWQTGRMIRSTKLLWEKEGACYGTD